ncbi:MAG: DNA-formamidopyrimidine glycosylase [Chloroflexi bacterium]|nr:DNA-formamidopyrimidine glycosylase [Chloroflexota bacterium]
MPELPEVETIARALRNGGREGPSLLGKTITSPVVLWQGVLATPMTPGELQQRLAGLIIRDVGRRAKFLIITLDRGSLLFHLRMSGDLRVEPASAPPAPHDRFLINFTDGDRLVFDDARKFGRVWLTENPQEILVHLGPEPLDPAFTPETLQHQLKAHHRQLKPLLLDQAFLAGMGNIYADEALHQARLHPLRLSHSLSPQEVEALWSAIRQVLQEAIARQGSSIDWVYRGGDFQEHFKVYQRTGEPCPDCGTPIVRIVVGQRGTHFCPTCQKPI